MTATNLEDIVAQVLAELKGTPAAPPTIAASSAAALASSATDSLVIDLSDPTEEGLRHRLGIDNPHDADGLRNLTATTPARLGVGRTGARPKTDTLLLFQADHAVTQGAIYGEVAAETLAKFDLFTVQTKVADRQSYLLRPDQGRLLSDEARSTIESKCIKHPDIQICVGDGLSAAAIDSNLADILPVLTNGFKAAGLSVGTPFFIQNARVGVMNDVNSIIAARVMVILIADRLKAEMQARGAHWLTKEEADKLAAMMFRPNGMMVATYVGRTAQYLGKAAGITVPDSARILVADLEDIGPKHPLSREKLTTVLGFMVVDGWKAGSMEMLKFGGDGHSVVIHSRDDESIMAWGIEKPAFRILVNTWGSLGGVGYTTALRPSFTLAPGGIGGAVVSDNITVENVLNVKRLAYDFRPVPAAARAYAGLVSNESSPASPAVGQTSSSDAEFIEKLVQRVLQEMKK